MSPVAIGFRSEVLHCRSDLLIAIYTHTLCGTEDFGKQTTAKSA